MKEMIAGTVFCAFLLFCQLPLHGETTPDPELVSAIAAIKVIDNHAHPLRTLKEGERDTEWGALTFHTAAAPGSDPGEEMPLVPFRLRPKSPEFPAVLQTLYGFSHGTLTKGLVDEFVTFKRRIMLEHGENYPSWVLDKIGVEIMLANRAVMHRSLPSPRFRWVSYADALMFPFSNEEARKMRPDLGSSYDGVERLRRTHLADLRLDRLPPSLEKYLAEVVTPTLERQKREGAVAVKFVTAYLRTLDISVPSEKQAKRIYVRYARGGKPTGGEYKTLQDFLFCYISREAGRLGLPVHIHTGLGIGRYFDVTHSNPLLLEPVFNDPGLRKTNFVILHTGWPFAKQTAAMLLKPNVYADFSGIAFLNYPREVSGVIRSFLEVSPDKVLFGSDGFEVNAGTLFPNWEEFTWIGTTSARQALAIALTEMIRDREITRDEALGIARNVLRGNAIRLYKLETP